MAVEAIPTVLIKAPAGTSGGMNAAGASEVILFITKKNRAVPFYGDVGESRRPFLLFRPASPKALRELPTTKPLPLMRHLLRTLTKPGDFVLDLLAGLGPLSEACLLDGRNCLAMEAVKANVDNIRHRCQKMLARLRSNTTDFGSDSTYRDIQCSVSWNDHVSTCAVVVPEIAKTKVTKPTTSKTTEKSVRASKRSSATSHGGPGDAEVEQAAESNSLGLDEVDLQHINAGQSFDAVHDDPYGPGRRTHLADRMPQDTRASHRAGGASSMTTSNAQSQDENDGNLNPKPMAPGIRVGRKVVIESDVAVDSEEDNHDHRKAQTGDLDSVDHVSDSEASDSNGDSDSGSDSEESDESEQPQDHLQSDSESEAHDANFSDIPDAEVRNVDMSRRTIAALDMRLVQVPVGNSSFFIQPFPTLLPMGSPCHWLTFFNTLALNFAVPSRRLSTMPSLRLTD